MKVAFVVYHRFALLDVAGPYESLSAWPGADVRVVATTPGPVRAEGGLTVTPSDTPETLPDPDVIVIPGGSRPLDPMGDEVLLDWVRRARDTATWLTSVCTGVGVYAAAGLLEGRRVATHWAFEGALKELGIAVAGERVVLDAPFATCAGVSAGIDMGLALTAAVHGDEAGRQTQLALHYDPQPPFDTGTPEKAGPERTQATLARLAAVAMAER